MTALTPRQREVLLAYLRTGSHKAAAHQLGMPIQSVKNHLSAAYGVLGVDNILGAAKAIGWLRVPE